MRRGAVYTLGVAFSHIIDKERAWEDLHRLTTDKDRYVQAFANYSLGRAFIFKATETENEKNFRKELKEAIEFFKKISLETICSHIPSLFCYSFYESFYKITFEGFEGVEAKYEVLALLEAAKLTLESMEGYRLINRSKKQRNTHRSRRESYKCPDRGSEGTGNGL